MREWEPNRITIKASAEGPVLPEVALSVAKTIAKERDLSLEMREELLSTVRAWTDYAKENQVDEENLFSVRWHLERFAQSRFSSKENAPLSIQSASIEPLTLPTGETFESYVEKVAGKGVFEDPDVAVFGGTARTALKLHGAQVQQLGQDETRMLVESELPLNDVDIMVNRSALTGQSRFTADLSGTRVVGDIETDMSELFSNHDCTFNQALIHKGRLYFTPEALKDACDGVIRFTDKEDALFGAEVEMLPDGKRYINRKGLYRAFAFLLRGKANTFPIHKDNLASEIPHMGRYWVVLLMVKLLPMKDEMKREEAVSGWFSLARNLGATQTGTPKEFLDELLTHHPEMRSLVVGREKGEDTKFDSQVRWLAGKLIDRAIDSVGNQRQKPPLQGMSDEEVVIDASYVKGEHGGVDELIGHISKLRESLPAFLQEATDADIAALLDIEKSVAGPKTYSPMLTEEDWREEMESSSVFLIRSGDQVVGNISYEEKSPEHLYISGLVVKPEFQGKGIAREVLMQVLSQHASARRVDLETHPDNPALKLYESLGFKVESRSENHFGDGEPRLILAIKK